MVSTMASGWVRGLKRKMKVQPVCIYSKYKMQPWVVLGTFYRLKLSNDNKRNVLIMKELQSIQEGLFAIVYIPCIQLFIRVANVGQPYSTSKYICNQGVQIPP